MTEEEIALQEEITLQEAATRPQPPTAKTALRLRELMQQQQVTLAQLSEAAGMHVANLSLLVNGKRNPTLDTLDRLAQALGCPTWHLIQDPDQLQQQYTAPLQEQLAQAEATVEALRASLASKEATNAELRQRILQTAPDSLPVGGKEAAPATAPQRPADGEMPDLLTTDPRTGETHRYRLIS